MSTSPWKPGGLPVKDDEQQQQARRDPGGVPAHARMQRVKVFRLTDDGRWDDQGTGHVTIDYIEGSRELALTVVDEEDNDTLLLHNITSDDIYRKQEETIILWKDPEKALELALSFQEAAGCSFIWESMHNIQQNLQFNVLGSQVGPHPVYESLEASRDSLSQGSYTNENEDGAGEGDIGDGAGDGSPRVSPVAEKRDKGKRIAHDSPNKNKKKKTFKDQCMKRLVDAYELMAQTSRNSATSPVVDHVRAEIAQLLELVIQDGAEEGSDEHYYATQLLMKKECRDVFITFKTPNGRLSWLRRAWEDRKKH